MKRLYQLACTIRRDTHGTVIAGCDKVWLTFNRTEGCPSCGLPGHIAFVWTIPEEGEDPPNGDTSTDPVSLRSA